MNLVQLKYFQAVCKYESVSAAAEALFVSQPTVSSAIKELESEFGVSLFKRHHKGMIPTTEGAELLTHAERLLSHADHVSRIMNDYGSSRKVLRLGVPPMIGSLFLPKIYREFTSQNPDITLDITEGGKKEMLDNLSNDLLDMVFISHKAPIGTSFQALEISKQEIVCCVCKHSPLAKRPSIAPKDLEKTPLVLFKDSFFQTEEIKKHFTDADIKPNIILQTSQLSTLHNMINNDIAVGFMFRDLAINYPNLVSIPFDTPINISISLVWNRDACLISSMEKFIKYIKNFAM